MATLDKLNNFSFLDHTRSNQLLLVCEILRVYNCRIGEILNASWTHFYSGKFLVLKAEKHSRDIIIRDRLILSAIDSLARSNEQKIFNHVSYSQVYHFLKSRYSHLFTAFKTKKNHKVTHYFRYANASLISDIEVAKSLLNHNSKKSCGYYNPKLKVK